MNAYGRPIASMLLLFLFIANAPQFASAIPPEPSELEIKLRAAAESDQPLSLQVVQELQRLLREEESRLQEESVALWIKGLRDSEFSAREIAEKQLINADVIAIQSVTDAAKQNDREVSERCITILAQIAKTQDEVATAKAQAALTELANDDTAIGRRASQVLAELNKTDKDRAVATLKSIGAYIHENKAGEVLSVSASQGISDREMRLVSALPRLTMLSVSGDGVTDAGLRNLSQLKHLQHISLLNTSVTDAGLKTLATFPGLEYLNIGSSKITTAGIAALKDSKSIQTIGFYEYLPDDAAIDLLATMNLRYISISLKHVTNDDLASLNKLSKLHSLSISESPQITDEGVAHISKLSLRTLRISDAQLTNEAVKHVSNMTSLTSLRLSGNEISDASLEYMKNLKNLRYFTVKYTGITTAGATKLKAMLPSLRRVY